MAKQKFISLFLLIFFLLLSCDTKVFDNPFDANSTFWNLNLTKQTSNTITLTWEDKVEGESGYKLYRKDTIINDMEISNKTLSVYQKISPNVVSFTDTFTTQKKLYYRLYAYDENENLSVRFAENNISLTK